MQSITYYRILLLGLLSLTGCEDVIVLDLESSEPQTIIEATINATTQTATVLLSNSNNFYDSDDQLTISDASVLLMDNSGLDYMLIETDSGIYQMDNIDMSNATSFALSIAIDGKLFEATAEVPSPVELDSIIVSSSVGGPLAGDGSQRLQALFQDTPEKKNYYRIRAYQNDTLLANTYTIFDDQVRGDGEEINVGVRELFEEDNTVTLELLSTNKAYYEYFFQLSSQSGMGGNSTTPFNPIGNLTNTGFGYFGIYYSSALSIEL